MSETDLLLESLRLLVVGMGIVFGFLLMLVGILRGMSAIVLKFPHLEAQPTGAGSAGTGPAQATGSESSEELLAVITAAVARYRGHH
ncbi:OadG family protein [Thiocystis violacea]|uniref:OadG family protein n=1 Tax=Thiocystis violacea TaxID=13725 RepID=UPI0019034ACF|nr:OadG family protein [Thiocystis violacea]MBK1722465.1 hypothetical protein [Thiocystis violacea]